MKFTSDEEQFAKFGAGEVVLFQTGMNFRSDVHQPVRNHYRFGE